jgi:hypothetical protein
MTADLRRIRAVAASLRGIRQRVLQHEDVECWSTAAYDNAVELLEGALDGADFSGHALNQDDLGPTEFLVHLDSLIAFLEVYEQSGPESDNVLAFPPRQQG